MFMRRCDRHTRQPQDPYQEFSFEKSLRKYEVGPLKKVKRDEGNITPGKTLMNIEIPLNDAT
jgi:hypothetical protein